MVAEEKKDEDSVQRSQELKVKRDGQGRKKSVGGGGGPGAPTSATNITSSSAGWSASIQTAKENNKKKKEAALAHLVRYETMVRQQEAEDMATLAYMKPCLERLVQLAAGTEDKKPVTATTASTSTSSSWRMDQVLSFRSLRVARQKLDAIERDAALQSEEREFLATDRQLLMVLRVLTKDEEFQGQQKKNDEDTTITWAEFVQCYKVCIAGMLTLQQLQVPLVPPGRRSSAEDAHSDSLSLASLRSRTRDRTVSMMSLFGPSSTRMLNSSTKSPKQSAASTPARRFLGLAVKGVVVLVVAAAALLGATWTYDWISHSASMRTRGNKPPRFVPLTSLYPPHFYNTSPPSATTGGLVPTSSPVSSRGLLQQDAFLPKTPPTHPRGIIPAHGVAGRLFPTHNYPTHASRTSSIPTSEVACESNKHQLSIWQHAIGGAVAMPLTTQSLFPPSVAGRFVATASLLTVAAVGIATNLLASLCAKAIVKVRQWLQSTPSSTSSRP